MTPILPGGEKTVDFLGHLFTDLLQIYLLLLVILFVVFWLQSFVDTGRMQRKLAGLKSVWGYLLAFALGLLSPFCSCGIIPVLMGLVAAGVPVAVCLCMYTTASLMNLTALTALYSIAGPAFTGVYLCCSLLIVAASSMIFSRLRFQGAARDFHADMPVELVFDGMSVGQTIIKGIGDVQVGTDGAFTLDVEVALLPDTVRTGPFTCVFATGTPITVKTESDAHTILYYVIKNGLK